MSKYTSKIIERPPRMALNNEYPPSIPGVVMPHYEIHDDWIDDAFRQKVHDYLMNRKWCQVWTDLHAEMQFYKPADFDEGWINAAMHQRKLHQPRTLFGSDLSSIEKLHPIIAELWHKINKQLGGNYEITGCPEGQAWKDYPCPTPSDPNLSTGWRVYANASPHDLISCQGYIHRDTPDVFDDSTVTILFVTTKEWYPSWGGEIFLYPEDPSGASGDHQQFNNGIAQQNRAFQIGWPDDGKVVSLKPGRLICYDGRTLHSTQPTRHRYNTEMSMRVAYRARKCKDN